MGLFQAEDSQVPKLAHALKTVADQQKDKLQNLTLEYFSSTNFIGIFVAEACAPYLKQVTQDFAEEVKKTGEWTAKFIFTLNVKYYLSYTWVNG